MAKDCNNNFGNTVAKPVSVYYEKLLQRVKTDKMFLNKTNYSIGKDLLDNLEIKNIA